MTQKQLLTLGCRRLEHILDGVRFIDVSSMYSMFPLVLSAADYWPPTQRVPVWTRRWGEIPQPSDEYALRAVLPYTAPSHT